MKRYNNSSSYVTHLQNRTISYLNYYYSLMETADSNDNKYYIAIAYERSREYELLIYNYLIELNPRTGAKEFKKHKKLIVEKI